MSADYARHIEPSVGAPLQVAMANGMVCTSPGARYASNCKDLLLI